MTHMKLYMYATITHHPTETNLQQTIGKNLYREVADESRDTERRNEQTELKKVRNQSNTASGDIGGKTRGPKWRKFDCNQRKEQP